ncbi:MAG: VOC family protein [Planctomycetota bacterium]
MSGETPEFGTIGWHDLTVDDASGLRDFYARVVGWEFSGLDMGGYEDYVMTAPATGDGVAGVCHARGSNAGVPPQWISYVVVQDLEGAVARAVEMGGACVNGPRGAGGGRMAIIRDPAGAVLGLYQP